MQTLAERGSGEASTRRPSDRELIARFLASRDESAFAEIVTRYSRLVMSVALHTLRDPHAAEDAFQAAFLVLAKSARRIRNRDSLASWLHGTTFRVSHRLLRTRLRRKEQDLPNVELTAPIWADPERPDEQAALDEELARLSDGLRGPLVLHYLEGRTVPEIAAELKMTQAAVEGRLKRGKRTLRKRLLRRGVLLSSAIFGAGLTVPVEAGVAGTLVTATVAACLKTAASASLTPIAATMVQQIAVQEMVAMTRIALLKTALVCGGVVGAVGLAGAGANGTLGMAWARQGGGEVFAGGAEPEFDGSEMSLTPSGVIQTALAQVPDQSPNVVIETDSGVLTADSLKVTGAAAVSSGGPESAPAAGRPPAAATNTKASEALMVAAQQAAARDQQVRALEQMVESLQAQVQQMRNDVARENARSGAGSAGGAGVQGVGLSGGGPTGTAGGTFGSGFGGGFGPAPRDVPGGASGGYGQPGTAPASVGGMGMGIMPGMPGMGGGMAGMMGGQGSAAPPRPRELEEVLKTAGQDRAKAVREYLSQLERRAGGVTAKTEPKVVQTFQSQRPSEERIREALDAPAEMQFTGQTLQEVMNFLGAKYEFNIRLDYPALTKAGVGPDQEINLVIKDLSLRSALDLMLADVGGTPLDYYIENEVVKVTTKEVADAKIETVIYDASSLGDDYTPHLESIIQQTVDPASWNQMGGKGTVVSIGKAVVVTTTRRLHDKIAEIMRMLEQHAKSTRANQ